VGWKEIACVGLAAWRDADDICALADQDRHLGHIVRHGRWHAFDGTHLNSERDGFRQVGIFESVKEAKAAVERSLMNRKASIVAIR
jgi:hypothetical protein